MTIGPSLPFSEELHAEKYRGPGESFKEAGNRIAGALSDGPEHFHAFRDAFHQMRFLPAGRIQSAVGSVKAVTPFNCFVAPSIEDSFVDGQSSIMAVAAKAAATMRMGGGIGYDFSTLRPRGDMITKLRSSSSGPVSFMQIYDSICKCISSSGHRRGAQMAVLRIDHPDIEEFIHAKQPPKEAEPILEMLAAQEPGSAEWVQWYQTLQAVYRFTGFNTSVGVTDEFMHCLRDGRDFPLRFGNQVYRHVDPHALWDTVMRSTWDWAEPGVLFLDTINRMNNLWWLEVIAATNPCGEQPLPPDGACLLGSFNLVKYIRDGEFDFEQFVQDIGVVVRAMDKVIDVATFPLYEQEKEAKNKRRMGLGVTGAANAIEATGCRYGDTKFLDLEAKILETLRDEAYSVSSDLAAEKGSFPLYNEEKYLQGGFIKTLRPDVIEKIKRQGIRNSHLLSIAPTGTISMCADNVSSGIEPVFSYSQKRIVNMPGGSIETDFEDYGVRVLGVKGKRCDEVTVDEHLNVLSVAAARVDSAVSKTCNVSPNMPFPEFRRLYVEAWERGCKGITTFQTGGKRAGILKSNDEDTATSCEVDLTTGRRSCE